MSYGKENYFTGYNYSFAQQGWQCPVCHRVYSPYMMMCSYCPGTNYQWNTNSGTMTVTKCAHGNDFGSCPQGCKMEIIPTTYVVT